LRKRLKISQKPFKKTLEKAIIILDIANPRFAKKTRKQNRKWKNKKTISDDRD